LNPNLSLFCNVMIPEFGGKEKQGDRRETQLLRRIAPMRH
jgi:hypothetical protein